MALSNVAGIGGGGIAVPVLIAFFYFTTKTAIAISSFSIFLTTLARFIMNFKERHPEKENVVVIDYDLVCIMMPTNLAGAQIGALILVTFPSLFIQIILTLTLAALAIQSGFKAREITKKEDLIREQAALALKKVSNDDQIKDTEGDVQLGEKQPVAVAPASDDAKLGELMVAPEKDAAAVVVADDDEFKREEAAAVAVKSEKMEDDKEYCKVLRMKVSADMNQNEIKNLRASVRSEASHF